VPAHTLLLLLLLLLLLSCRLEWRRKNQTKDATLEGVDRVVSC
jgi:hypothetical protein